MEPSYRNSRCPEFPPEGKMAIAYEEIPFELNGDEGVTLRRPAYSVTDLGYGAVAADVRLSPRVAPPMIGLGLLEAVTPATSSPEPIRTMRTATGSRVGQASCTTRAPGSVGSDGSAGRHRPRASGSRLRRRSAPTSGSRPRTCPTVGRLHGGPTRVPDEAVRSSASPWRHRGPGAGAGARLVLCVEPRGTGTPRRWRSPRFCAARRYSTGRDVLRATRRST